MPTPTSSFLQVAAQFGKVAPDDIEAVQRWYTEVVPTLSPETIREILDALLTSDGTVGDKDMERSYPSDVPLPSLSSSPPEPTPLLAAGWRELLIRLTRFKG